MESPKDYPVPHSLEELPITLPDPGADGYRFFENAANHPLEASTGFRQVNAWWAIEMSYLSYARQEAYALDCIRQAGWQGAAFGFANPEPPHILVAHNDAVAIVAFRGTRVDSLPDVLADISFLPSLTLDGLVHRGFQKALLNGGVWEQAERYLASISAGRMLLFTGHSLGAALATLARRNCHQAGAGIVLYTFGSPRVGDELVYCHTYPGPAWRVVNDEDIVTHIPSPPIYGHIGQPVGVAGEPLPGGEWESLEHRFASLGAALSVFSFDKRRSLLRNSLEEWGVKPLGDHAPRAYAAKIWNALIGAKS